MAKDIITGLVPGASSVEWVSIQKSKGGFSKLAEGEVALDGEAASGGFRNIKGDVTACISSDQALIRVVELPGVDDDDDELRSMVELQVDKFSPFPIESVVFSHEVLQKREGNCLVLVVAVKADVIEAMGKKLSGVGIETERIDIDAMGWLRLLGDEGKILQKGRQVFILVTSTPLMIVVQDGVAIALRTLSAGQGMSREDVLLEIAAEAGYTLMSMELEHGTAPSISLEVYAEADIPAGFIDELKRECGSDAQVNQLALLPSLAEGIARRAADEKGGMLDLTPVSWRQAETKKQSRKKMITITAVLSAAWMLMAGGFMGYVFYQERDLASLLVEQANWEKPANEVRDMAGRIRIIQQYMDRTDSALECLREVTELLPQSGIELSTFNYKKGESLTLTGDALARGIVLEYNDNLNKSKIFTQVIPGDIKIMQGKHRFNFVLTFPGGEGE